MTPKPDLLKIDELRRQGSNIRLHGNRFIQIDLPGDMNRVHVWSDIIPVAQRRNSQWHDHTFGFRSEILAGTLINTVYAIFAGASYQPWRAVPRGEGADTQLIRAGNCCDLVPCDPELYHAAGEFGGIYTVPPGTVHATSYIGFAVTHMVKLTGRRFTGEGPFVYCPIGYEPDNDFNRYKYPAEQLWEIVAEVLKQV